MNHNPFCYICHAQLVTGEPTENWAGHHAHKRCVEGATKAGLHQGIKPGVSDVPTTPAVPRMWETENTSETPYVFEMPKHETNGMFYTEHIPGKVALLWVLPKELITDGPNYMEICAEVKEILILLLTKNRAYGSSFAKGLNVFSKLTAVEAINARMDDKLARMKQAKDYSEDTEADLIGYLVLKRIALKMEAKPQLAAFMDPAFGGTDKTVVGVFGPPGPRLEALREKIEKTVEALKESADKAATPGIPEKMRAYREMCEKVKSGGDGEQIIEAQHEETGHMWKGSRYQLPPRYLEVKASKEPIPPGVYWSEHNHNFYSYLTKRGLGCGFYTKWETRSDEFPQEIDVINAIDALNKILNLTGAPSTPAASPAPPAHSPCSEGPAACPPV